MTTNSWKGLSLVLAVALTACSAEERDPGQVAQAAAADQAAGNQPESPVKAEFVIALDGEGLRFVNAETGSTSLLAFGVDRSTTDGAIAEHLGKADERSSNQECGAGPMEFTHYGAFSGNFQEDRFVGWSLRDGDRQAPLTTMSGIRIGTKRSEMSESVVFDIYEDSSIGTEFRVSGDEPGGFSGLFENETPDARITDLWAGTSCIFR